MLNILKWNVLQILRKNFRILILEYQNWPPETRVYHEIGKKNWKRPIYMKLHIPIDLDELNNLSKIQDRMLSGKSAWTDLVPGLTIVCQALV